MMIRVETVNSVYFLDDLHHQYRREAKDGLANPNAADQKNLVYDDWHKMDNWTITDADQLLIAYPDSECPHNGGPECTGNHWILTSLVESVDALT